MVPLQSSFAKPQTPTDVGKYAVMFLWFPLQQLYEYLSLPGLVQHKVVVWLYFALELSVPAVLYSALSYNGSLVSILVSHNNTKLLYIAFNL